MERFNDSDQRGVLEMHGFRSLSEANKQTAAVWLVAGSQ
ncbi:transposase [Xanthomonas phaseoli pv. dieffenbachiae]